MAIFLNKLQNYSIARQLFIYFLLIGTLLFGGLLLTLSIFSQDFAKLALKQSLNGIAQDMEGSLYVDAQGIANVDDSEIMLKWGFDALYSNIAYRLIDPATQEVVLRSEPDEARGRLFDDIPDSMAIGYANMEINPEKSIAVFRLETRLDKTTYYLDVARSDLLGELANEAVLPAVQDFWKLAIIFCFVLFLVVTFIAVRLILRPVKLVSDSVASISPERLDQRLGLRHVPTELVPIIDALNLALTRVEKGFKQQQQFVANAAHELRTPLSVLSNRIELNMPTSELKPQLLTDVGNMSRIVEQLLDLARAQNLIVSASENADLVVISKDICTLLVPLALTKHQQLELNAQCDEAPVKISAGDLSVVVKNLVENAIKHSPTGAGITVSIDKASISVEDSGPGIDEEDKYKIFERFYRGNQSALNGSGLGLSIVEETLAKNDAEIAVSKSKALGGSMFKVSFQV
ncbi:MAG: ATP-binding protein [Pseudomonadota bacterium]